jgi:hypothetical protein
MGIPRMKSFAAMLLIWCGIVNAAPEAGAAWQGLLRDAAGHPLGGATVILDSSRQHATASTDADGNFNFPDLAAGRYSVAVRRDQQTTRSQEFLEIQGGERIDRGLQLTASGELLLQLASAIPQAAATGGERLSGRNVAGLPLNKRDFSQLLLLASGAQTDSNGAANFTQQFAVNGQRGTAAVFAMDGVDTTDPALGGATFSNFNVDAIQQIGASSGVMPAEIGEGAASFTNVITKSGTDRVHGAIFEFIRNAAFDARNFFDRRSIANPGRLPPFQRNEFGFTNGGPVVLPGIYDGRGKTFYFGQYQGFRQELGTTQVLAVPTGG